MLPLVLVVAGVGPQDLSPIPAHIPPPHPHSPASPRGQPALSHPGDPGTRDRDRVSARQGDGLSARWGDSAVLTGAPSLPFSPGSPRSPRGPPSPCSGDRHRVVGEAGTFPAPPPEGVLTPKEGCPQ